MNEPTTPQEMIDYWIGVQNSNLFDLRTYCKNKAVRLKHKDSASLYCETVVLINKLLGENE